MPSANGDKCCANRCPLAARATWPRKPPCCCCCCCCIYCLFLGATPSAAIIPLNGCCPCSPPRSASSCHPRSSPPLPKSSLPWSPTPQVWGMGLWVRLEWRVKPWSGRVGSPTVTLGLRLVCVWPSEGQSAMPWSFPTLVWRLLRGFQAGNPNWDLRLKMVPRGRLCAPPHPARSKVPPHSAAKLRKLSANVGRFAASACLRCSAPRPQACCHGRSTESMAAISEKHIHRDETLGWGGTSGRETVLRGRFPSGRAERYCSTSLRSSTAYNRDAELPAPPSATRTHGCTAACLGQSDQRWGEAFWTQLTIATRNYPPRRQQRARTVAWWLVWDNLTSDGGRRFWTWRT